MISEREHRLGLIREDIRATIESREAEQARLAEETRQAEEAARAERERRESAPARSTEEVAAAFGDWERRRAGGGQLARQQF